jgi:hypothetical protein
LDFEMKLGTTKLIGIGILAATGLGAQAATVTLASPGNAGTFASASTLALYDVGSGITSAALTTMATFLSVPVANLVATNVNLTNSSTAATQTFFDDYVFTVSSGMNLSLSALALPLTTTGLSESLYLIPNPPLTYTAVGANPMALASLVTPTTATSWNNLTAGNYVLQFTGVVSKATTLLGRNVPSIGAFASVVTLTPVPETETYAMLLAGLGLIGTVIRRKAKQA